MIKVYKHVNGLSPDIMSDIFKLRENIYNLRNFHIFESQNPRTKIATENTSTTGTSSPIYIIE